MPMPRYEKIAGLVVFALAVSAVTATPEAHADLLKDFGKDLERASRDGATDTINGAIDAATPLGAKRAALGLPGEHGTVAEKVVGRVMKDASSSTYGNYASAQSALKVPGLPGSGSLPGRSSSLTQSLSSSVRDVARRESVDRVRSKASSIVGKALGAILDRDDDPPSP